MSLDKLLHRVLGGLAAVMVLLMMIVTTIDVTGRYILGKPLTGAFEITELSLAALVFLGLPLATARDEHIRVGLLDTVMPEGLKRFATLGMDWLSAVVLAVLAWQLLQKTASLVSDGHVTNTLEIPLSPVAALMSASCVLSAAVLVTRGIAALRGDNQPGKPYT